MSDKDFSAIGTWERNDQGDDPNEPGQAPRYLCAQRCGFEGDYLAALAHHVNTAHQIHRRGVEHWGPVQFPQFMTRKG